MMTSPDKAAGKRALDAMMTMVKFDIAALKAAFDGPVRRGSFGSRCFGHGGGRV
jgi:hypothetical protein